MNYLAAISLSVLVASGIIVRGMGDPGPAAAAPEASVSQALQEATDFLFNESLATIERLGEPERSSRRAVLAEATALLNVQPRTQANIEAAVDLLEAIYAQDPDDAVGIAARYLHARVEHHHLSADDEGRAAELYRWLIAHHPDHPFAQQSIVKLSILRIYARDDGASKPEVLAELEANRSLLTDDEARKDFHLLMGDAYLTFDASDEKALEHFIEARRLGIRNPLTRGNLLLSIGNLAARLEQPRVAAECFRQFLEENPRDNRTYTVQRLLKNVTADEG